MNKIEKNNNISEKEKIEQELYSINEDLRELARKLDRHIEEYENPIGSGRYFSDYEVDSGKPLSQIADEDIEKVLLSIHELAAKRRDLIKRLQNLEH